MVQRILVPLDGTRSSASVVPYAAEMASRMPFKVNLLLVQPERGARLPHPEHPPARQPRSCIREDPATFIFRP